ncbi:MAG: DNA-binding protein [Clostridia bacterium]|nr:DNA-binding protein [Clostridia bacterium]
MEKDLIYSELYEVYKNLLTENQSEVFNLYYLCDLSLGEISEIKKISRQGVNDTLNKTRELLLDYEEKLGLLTIKRKVSILRAEIKDESLLKKLDDIFGDL